MAMKGGQSSPLAQTITTQPFEDASNNADVATCCNVASRETRIRITEPRIDVGTMGAKAELKVQNWGNNLAVRIPAPVARAARLKSGQQVTVEAVDGQIIVSPHGSLPSLTLEQMVKAFDAKIHGGEVMADAPRGKEFR
jgi:antitoxin MazE